MPKLEELKERLQDKKASLVVAYENGDIKEYYQDRIKDIREILQENPLAFKNAIVADKVIGKLAASILTVAGVKEIYAEVISELAIPILEENYVDYQYGEKVHHIINKEGTGMCPMENRFQNEKNIQKIYQEILE